MPRHTRGAKRHEYSTLFQNSKYTGNRNQLCYNVTGEILRIHVILLIAYLYRVRTLVKFYSNLSALLFYRLSVPNADIVDFYCVVDCIVEITMETTRFCQDHNTSNQIIFLLREDIHYKFTKTKKFWFLIIVFFWFRQNR